MIDLFEVFKHYNYKFGIFFLIGTINSDTNTDGSWKLLIR